MSAAKHTPGPWVIDWNVSRLDIFSSDAATQVATLRRSTMSDGIDKAAIANARLIAVAPQMLEALETVLWAEDNQPDHWPDAIRHVRAAVAKATGVAQ
jgi:hypothetical protein